MPLVRSASKQAFSKNVSREMKAGKPQRQAVAIAYSEKREAQRRGGHMTAAVQHARAHRNKSGY